MKVGDLVVVQKPRPCCGSTHSMGRIFIVVAMRRTSGHCAICDGGVSFTTAASANGETWYEVSRLRVIPPFPELIDELIADEVTV